MSSAGVVDPEISYRMVRRRHPKHWRRPLSGSGKTGNNGGGKWGDRNTTFINNPFNHVSLTQNPPYHIFPPRLATGKCIFQFPSPGEKPVGSRHVLPDNFRRSTGSHHGDARIAYPCVRYNSNSISYAAQRMSCPSRSFGRKHDTNHHRCCNSSCPVSPRPVADS